MTVDCHGCWHSCGWGGHVDEDQIDVELQGALQRITTCKSREWDSQFSRGKPGKPPIPQIKIYDFRKAIGPSYQPTQKPEPELERGCIVVKRIACGKRCSGCPHGPYAYLVTKKDGRQTWKYLGLAKDLKLKVGKINHY